MANHGKRMVKENLIAQIGETGPEYTAGNGIDINNGVISTTVSSSNGITTYYHDQVLQITTDSNVVKKPIYWYEVKPGVNPNDPSDPSQGTYTVTIEEFLAGLPILETETFKPATDTKFGNNTVISVPKNDPMINSVFLRGFFGIRDTDNDTINVVCTAAANTSYEDASLIGKLQNAEITRYGSNNWKFKNERTNRLVTFTESESSSLDVLMIGYADGTDTGIATTLANGEANVPVKIINPKIGTNYAQQVVVPNVEGTYVLKATVDNNGQVSKLEWVLEQ